MNQTELRWAVADLLDKKLKDVDEKDITEMIALADHDKDGEINLKEWK